MIQPETDIFAILAQASKPIDAIYLHTPFCFHKCHYCDFFSVIEPSGRVGDPDRRRDQQAQFVTRIADELTLRCSQVALRPRTVFVGGGTPTLLRAELWRALLEHMRTLGVLETAEEVTVEANPETVTPELLSLLVDGGVNRVSIGAQSFNPNLLKTLERWHDPSSVTSAVIACRDAGMANVNLDLIFAIPGQTLASLRSDLDRALALQPDHLSCYGLTYEPHTPMTKRLKMGQFRAVDEALERQMYALVQDHLEAAGYERYEVSNWARPGKQCQHNLIYWRNDEWLGLGPSAASHINGHRWKNRSHLGAYLASHNEPPIEDHECLEAQRRVGESLMMGLRLKEGSTCGGLGTTCLRTTTAKPRLTNWLGSECLNAPPPTCV